MMGFMSQSLRVMGLWTIRFRRCARHKDCEEWLLTTAIVFILTMATPLQFTVADCASTFQPPTFRLFSSKRQPLAEFGWRLQQYPQTLRGTIFSLIFPGPGMTFSAFDQRSKSFFC
jgi:hypothetical protein